MGRHFNGPLALALFVAAAYWVVTHPVPWYAQGGLFVAAYALVIHWIYQYSPFAARWILSTTLLIIFAIIKGVLSISSGRR